MFTSSRLYTLAAFLATTALVGCDNILGPDGQTRILFSQGSSAGASLSVSPGDAGDVATGKSYGTAVLALVDKLEVTITAVQAQPARYIDMPESEQHWETLTLADPVTVDLLGLPTSENGLEVISGDLAPGAYVRLRLLVSEAALTLRAPLTIGKETFEAAEPIEIDIPDAWVRVPGAFFTVTEEGATVSVEFDPSVSLGQLTMREGRLRLTPVIRGKS